MIVINKISVVVEHLVGVAAVDLWAVVTTHGLPHYEYLIRRTGTLTFTFLLIVLWLTHTDLPIPLPFTLSSSSPFTQLLYAFHPLPSYYTCYALCPSPSCI